MQYFEDLLAALLNIKVSKVPGSLIAQITADPLLAYDLRERLAMYACGVSIVSNSPRNIVR